MKISPQGAGKLSADDAKKVFDQIYADDDGNITAGELKPAVGNDPPAKRSACDGKPAGAPAARGGGGAASTSANQTYPADTNRDGKVSVQGQQAEGAKQAAKKANAEGPTNDTHASAAKTYEEVDAMAAVR